jgi:hypothetical protein
MILLSVLSNDFTSLVSVEKRYLLDIKGYNAEYCSL